MDPIRVFRSGRVIFREGEAPGNVYLVVSGKVKLVKNYGTNQTVLDYIGKNGVFGEMAMFDKLPRSATAIAEEDTECYTLNQIEFQKRLDQTDPFILGIIRIMSERLRSTSVNYADAKQTIQKIKTKVNTDDT